MNKIFSTTFLIALLLVSFVCGTTCARPQDKLVEDIELRGYKRVSREEILKHVKTKPGEVFKEEQAKLDFEEVLKMGIFDRPNCKLHTEAGPRGGVVVIFELKELAVAPQTKKEESSVINLDELQKTGARRAIPSGSLLLIEGALYMPVGNTVLPVPGGGASGCFDPGTDSATRVERAKARFAKFQADAAAK
jgi:hypothetical protein